MMSGESKKERLNYLSTVSETTPHHPDETNEVVFWIPQMIWASAHVQDEIVAGAADLKTVAHYCRRGKVATAELAELVGDSSIAEADPEDTEIIEVNLNIHKRELDILYVVKEEPWWNMIKPWMMGLMLVCGGKVILIIYLIIRCCRREKPMTVPANSTDDDISIA